VRWPSVLVFWVTALDDGNNSCHAIPIFISSSYQLMFCLTVWANDISPISFLDSRSILRLLQTISIFAAKGSDHAIPLL
jgi:hypothetical protein